MTAHINEGHSTHQYKSLKERCPTICIECIDRSCPAESSQNGETCSRTGVELSIESTEKDVKVKAILATDDSDLSQDHTTTPISPKCRVSTKSKMPNEKIKKNQHCIPSLKPSRKIDAVGRSLTPFDTISASSEFIMMSSIPEEGSDEDNDDLIFEAMDYLEDEIDGNTYDEFIPLQIRIALEDQIFGWDHFLSSLIGHVGYTVGSYLLTFWIVTYIYLKEVPWENCDATNQSKPWHIPNGLFSFMRTIISLSSAVSTFRTIRRRRRIWLRQPLGSTQYLTLHEAQRRKASLREADQRAKAFVLGSNLWKKLQRSYLRNRDRYLARRVKKKLLKAQTFFEKTYNNRIKLIRTWSNSSLLSLSDSENKDHSLRKGVVPSTITRYLQESSHHARVKILASSGSDRHIESSRCKVGDDAGSLSGTSIGTTCEKVSDYPSFSPLQIRNSLTLPNFAMASVSHDQIPFTYGEIKKIPYVHGGFFGAAPFMLTNPHWVAILRGLMPDVYVEISRRASFAQAPKLIHWAENNPVVAAYGTSHEIEFSGRVPTLEWDVFLDPYLVRRVEIVLNERESFIRRMQDTRKLTRQSKCSERILENVNDTALEKIDEFLMESSANERLVLKYYDTECRRRTEILVERMLIAHGNIFQLILEQCGTFKKYNFSRVKRTRKTLGGGIFAKQWLAVFAEAMRLGLRFEEGADEDCDSESDVSIESSDDLQSPHEAENSNNAVEDNGSYLDVSAGRLVSSVDIITDTRIGPPKKILLNRSMITDDDIDDKSSDVSLTTESPLHRHIRVHRKRRVRYSRNLGTKVTSLQQASICPDTSIHESISILKRIVQCSAPLGILLDIKSRHVSRKVWALVIDFLRDSGARVEGIASFFVEEVRDISQYCSSFVYENIFFHTAGEIQYSCHKGLLRRGDRVFFNAGSLLWDYPDLGDTFEVKNILLHRLHLHFDGELIKGRYRLKPYAKVRRQAQSPTKRYSDGESETCDESTVDDADSTSSDLFTKLLLADRRCHYISKDKDFPYEYTTGEVCSTIQEYKDHYELSIGLYVQEFAIDEAAISLIVKYVNDNPHVYDLGLSWGGINGITVRGIQPGRFTATDGLWNQRYAGMPWKKQLWPSQSFEPNSTDT